MLPDKTLRFESDIAKTLFDNKILDLPTLQDRLPDSTLVAFDTEGVKQHFDGRQVGSEDIGGLGVAVFRPSIGRLQFTLNLTQFYEDNDMEAFTVRICDRPYSPAVGMMTEKTAEEAGPRLVDFLSSCEGDRILLGYDMQTEWRWIARKCPSLAALFTSWCDVQELIAQQHAQLTPRPGMDKTLKAMGIWGWTSSHPRHGGAADAVKLLAILSGLLCSAPLRTESGPKQDSVSKYCHLPRADAIQESPGKFHFHTCRISTADGQKLPQQTPNGLAKMFSSYEGLKGVGLNSRTQALARAPVNYWWVSFRTLGELEDFKREVDGSAYEGTTLRVTIDVKPAQPSEQSKPKSSIEARKPPRDLTDVALALGCVHHPRIL